MKQVMRTTIPSVWCLLRIVVFFTVTIIIAATKLLFCDKPFFPVSLWFHIEWFLFIFSLFKVIRCNMFLFNLCVNFFIYIVVFILFYFQFMRYCVVDHSANEITYALLAKCFGFSRRCK